MRTEKLAFLILAFLMILAMSLVAVYGFQYVSIMIQNEMAGFRNIAYVMAVVLSFSSLYRRDRRNALVFSAALSVALLLLFTIYPVVWQSSWTALFLALMLGILGVAVIPETRGNEFALFLMTLILPLVMAESRLLSSLMAQNIGMSFYQIYSVTIMIAGGYFYIRHVTWAKVMEKELGLKGGGEEELTLISWRSSLWAMAIVACAITLNATLAVFAVTITNQLSYPIGEPFVLLLIVAGIVAVAIVLIVYALAEKTLKE